MLPEEPEEGSEEYEEEPEEPEETEEPEEDVGDPLGLGDFDTSLADEEEPQ